MPTSRSVFWPVAMDAKYKDVEAMEDGSILLTLFNGGIRNDENEHIAKLLRKKSKILVAFGSCANEGCIPGLANFSDSREIVHTAFNTITTDNPHEIYPMTSYDVPEGEIHIPKILPTLKTLDQVVDVDYFMPGCPPESHQIAAVIDLVVQVLQGKAELPPKGSVIGAGNSTVCDECKRARNVKIDQILRAHLGDRTGSSLCLLEQGIPATAPPRAADATRAAQQQARSASAATARLRASSTTARADRCLCIGASTARTRRRSTASSTAWWIPPDSSIGSIWPVRCCTLAIPAWKKEKA